MCTPCFPFDPARQLGPAAITTRAPHIRGSQPAVCQSRMAGFVKSSSVDSLPCAASVDRSRAHALASSSERVCHSRSTARNTARAQRQPLECRALAAAALMSPTLPRTFKPGLESAANNISVAPPKLSPPLAADEGSTIQRIHSDEELARILKANPKRLVVLMCKALSCRPCKAFTRRYMRMAESFSDCLFLDIYGDETPNTRKMMINMKVRVTPTFKIYCQGECVHSHGGINETSLRDAIQEYMPVL